MGEHHREDRGGRGEGTDRDTRGLARVAGRGAVVATAALSLAGTGGGLAIATPGHDGDHGHDAGWEDGHDDVVCDAEVSPDLAGGLLSDLGLTAPRLDDLCADEVSRSHVDPGHADSHDSYSGESSEHGRTDRAAPRAAASEVDPAQDLPAPGETRVIDLPDRT